MEQEAEKLVFLWDLEERLKKRGLRTQRHPDLETTWGFEVVLPMGGSYHVYYTRFSRSVSGHASLHLKTYEMYLEHQRSMHQGREYWKGMVHVLVDWNKHELVVRRFVTRQTLALWGVMRRREAHTQFALGRDAMRLVARCFWNICMAQERSQL